MTFRFVSVCMLFVMVGMGGLLVSETVNADDGKVIICHATGSSTHPYVEITVSKSAAEAHARHQGGHDIIPAPKNGCPATATRTPTVTTAPTVKPMPQTTPQRPPAAPSVSATPTVVPVPAVTGNAGLGAR